MAAKEVLEVLAPAVDTAEAADPHLHLAVTAMDMQEAMRLVTWAVLEHQLLTTD